MNDTTIIEIAVRMMTVSGELAAPMLLTALAVGLAVSLIQSVTSIQEMTLTFVPKMAGVALAIVLSGHWMLNTLVGFTDQLFPMIPQLVGWPGRRPMTFQIAAGGFFVFMFAWCGPAPGFPSYPRFPPTPSRLVVRVGLSAALALAATSQLAGEAPGGRERSSRAEHGRLHLGPRGPGRHGGGSRLHHLDYVFGREFGRGPHRHDQRPERVDHVRPHQRDHQPDDGQHFQRDHDDPAVRHRRRPAGSERLHHLVQVRGLTAKSVGLLGATLMSEVGFFFLAAVEIAAPVLAAMFLAYVALGLLTRSAPQLNVMSLGFAINIALALVVVGACLPLLPGQCQPSSTGR